MMKPKSWDEQRSTDLPAILMLPLIIFASSTAGFIYGIIPGALKAYLGANELVSTLMLNVIATYYCGITRSYPEFLFFMGMFLLITGIVAGRLAKED